MVYLGIELEVKDNSKDAVTKHGNADSCMSLWVSGPGISQSMAAKWLVIFTTDRTKTAS